MVMLTAGWVRKSFWAAREKLRSRATVRKTLSSAKSIRLNRKSRPPLQNQKQISGRPPKADSFVMTATKQTRAKTPGPRRKAWGALGYKLPP